MMQAAKQQCYSQNRFAGAAKHFAVVQVRHSAADQLWSVVFIVLVTPTQLQLFCLLSISTHNWTSQKLPTFIDPSWETCFDSWQNSVSVCIHMDAVLLSGSLSSFGLVCQIRQAFGKSEFCLRWWDCQCRCLYVYKCRQYRRVTDEKQKKELLMLFCPFGECIILLTFLSYLIHSNRMRMTRGSLIYHKASTQI